jgi:hypothetical protein
VIIGSLSCDARAGNASARWFEGVASPAIVQSIYRFKTDALSVSEDFLPVVE